MVSTAKSDAVGTCIRVAAGTRWKSLFIRPIQCEDRWTGEYRRHEENRTEGPWQKWQRTSVGKP